MIQKRAYTSPLKVTPLGAKGSICPGPGLNFTCSAPTATSGGPATLVTPKCTVMSLVIVSIPFTLPMLVQLVIPVVSVATSFLAPE